MIVLDIYGFPMPFKHPPILIMTYMIGLLVLLIAISKLFFWLFFDIKSPVEKKLVAKQLYITPDVLMQISSHKKNEINNLEVNLQNTKSIWLRFVAVVLAVILCLTHLGDLLSPYKDYF